MAIENNGVRITTTYNIPGIKPEAYRTPQRRHSETIVRILYFYVPPTSTEFVRIIPTNFNLGRAGAYNTERNDSSVRVASLIGSVLAKIS